MGDCDQFDIGSRKRQICEGVSGLPRSYENAFRIRNGLDPLPGNDHDPHISDTRAMSAIGPGGLPALSGSRGISVTVRPNSSPKKTGGCCGKSKITAQASLSAFKEGTGVGGRLIQMFKEHGFETCDACYELALRMNNWGIGGCRKNLELIVEDILPRALEWEREKVGWWAKLVPQAVTAIAIRALVEQAIETASPLEAIKKPKPPVVFRPKSRVFSGNRPARPTQEKGPFTSMFVTNGIGDIITISCYLRVTPEIKTIYYATRKYEYVKEYLSLLCHPDTEHINVWEDNDNRFAWFSLKEFRGRKTHSDFPNTIDWSIFQVFPRNLPFLGLPFEKEQIKGLVRDFGLPERYAVLAPFTTDKRDSKRDLTHEEIGLALKSCRENGMPVVLINNGSDPVINAPGLTNLQNKTSLFESIYITMNSSMFIGTCSSMSVVATKTLPSDRLLIRSFSSNLNRWKHAYYAPHNAFGFITTDLRSGLRKLKWTK